VSGASLLLRREVLDSVGLLDEGYFLYYEEVDLCRRAARAGWECWHEPASRVVHLGGQATGTNPTDSVRRVPGYVLESRRRYFVKHHGVAYATVADLAWLAGHLAWRLRMRLQRRPDRAAPGVLGDFLRHSVLARGGPT
jgi:GT2 family glycosyltransferase